MSMNRMSLAGGGALKNAGSGIMNSSSAVAQSIYHQQKGTFSGASFA